MPSKVFISPSILSADPLNMGAEIASAERAGADWHHLDVMDGHFVPNLTFGPPLIRAIKSIASIPLDVHIMVSNPDSVALDYVDAGAHYLTFHVEAAVHAHRLLHAIRERGAHPGVAINPGTHLAMLEPLLPYLDIINVMSVNPGFGGQKFIERTVERIRAIRQMIEAARVDHHIHIEVDGGINAETAARVIAAGADVLVAGTFVYNSTDRAKSIQSLRPSG